MNNIKGIEEAVNKVNRSRVQQHILFNRITHEVYVDRLKDKEEFQPYSNDMAVVKILSPEVPRFTDKLNDKGEAVGDYEIKVTAKEVLKLCNKELAVDRFRNWKAQLDKASKLK